MFDAVGGYHREDDSFIVVGVFLDAIYFVHQIVMIILVYSEGFIAEFHFTQIDGVIFPVDYHVNLGTIAVAASVFYIQIVHIGQNATDLQGFLDLSDMLKTNPFKSDSYPRQAD